MIYHAMPSFGLLVLHMSCGPWLSSGYDFLLQLFIPGEIILSAHIPPGTFPPNEGTKSPNYQGNSSLLPSAHPD